MQRPIGSPHFPLSCDGASELRHQDHPDDGSRERDRDRGREEEGVRGVIAFSFSRFCSATD